MTEIYTEDEISKVLTMHRPHIDIARLLRESNNPFAQGTMEYDDWQGNFDSDLRELRVSIIDKFSRMRIIIHQQQAQLKQYEQEIIDLELAIQEQQG